MSRYIATRAIRGANALVTEAEFMLNKALAEKGGSTPISFPNTAYYLPTIYGLTGIAVETLGQLKDALQQEGCDRLGRDAFRFGLAKGGLDMRHDFGPGDFRRDRDRVGHKLAAGQAEPRAHRHRSGDVGGAVHPQRRLQTG